MSPIPSLLITNPTAEDMDNLLDAPFDIEVTFVDGEFRSGTLYDGKGLHALKPHVLDFVPEQHLEHYHISGPNRPSLNDNWASPDNGRWFDVTEVQTVQART